MTLQSSSPAASPGIVPSPSRRCPHQRRRPCRSRLTCRGHAAAANSCGCSWRPPRSWCRGASAWPTPSGSAARRPGPIWSPPRSSTRTFNSRSSSAAPWKRAKPRHQVRSQGRQPRCRQDQMGRGQRHLGQEGRFARRHRRLLPSGTGHQPEDRPRQGRVRQDHRGAKLSGEEERHRTGQAELWTSGSRAISRSNSTTTKARSRPPSRTSCKQQDRTAWVARMVKKGYMTASQEESEEATCWRATNWTLQKVQELKKVLIRLHRSGQPADVRECDQAGRRTSERAGLRRHASTQAVFKQQDAQYKDLARTNQAVQGVRPASGIVVYARPRTDRAAAAARRSRSSPRASRCSTARR